MFKKLEEVIPFKAYPKAAGKELGYRCFDGRKWHDCDETGKIIRYNNSKAEA